MKTTTHLEQLANGLQEESYDAIVLPAGEKVPFDRLVVYLGQDPKQREHGVEITLQEQIVDASLLKEKDETRFFRAQFLATLPFSAAEETTGQVSSLIAFLNRQLALPGFELDEVGGGLFFRHVFLTGHKGIDPTICRSLLGTIFLFLDLYSTPLEQVAKGEMSFNDLLRQAVSLVKKEIETGEESRQPIDY